MNVCVVLTVALVILLRGFEPYVFCVYSVLKITSACGIFGLIINVFLDLWDNIRDCVLLVVEVMVFVVVSVVVVVIIMLVVVLAVVVVLVQ
jgi:hypothetical protein